MIGGNVQFGGINNVAGGGSAAANWNGNVDLGNVTRTITLGGNTQTFAGVISNGGLTVSASGGTYTLAITTPSTYAGGTTINTDATLSLGNATDTLKDDGTINVNGGTLNVDNPDTVGAVTLSSGTISGDSALTGSSYAVQSGEITTGLAGSGIVMTKSTPGVVIANNSTSSYDGGTVLNEGTLAIRASGTPLGTGPITINGGIIGSVVITRTIPNDVVVNSDFQLGGVNVPALATSGTTFNGNVNLGGATRTITLANSATFNGVISNGGLTIIANPTNRVLTLAGNSTYTGLTNLNAGTLIINGDNSAATGQINVAADALIGGNGTSGAAVVFTPGAGLAARITDWTGAAGTGYEDLAVASLNAGGGALNLVVTATGLVNFTETNKSFTILNASGGISGFNPANVTITTTGFTGTGTWALAQSGTSLVLNYTGADPFQNWIDPFTVADETKGGDPDNDGSSNLMEFVLNGNPGISDTNILPDLALNSTDFTFSYVRREDSTGVPQVVQYGSEPQWVDGCLHSHCCRHHQRGSSLCDGGHSFGRDSNRNGDDPDQRVCRREIVRPSDGGALIIPIAGFLIRAGQTSSRPISEPSPRHPCRFQFESLFPFSSKSRSERARARSDLFYCHPFCSEKRYPAEGAAKHSRRPKMNLSLITTLIGLTASTVCAQLPQAEIRAGGEWLPFASKTLDSRSDYTVNPANLELSKYGGWLNGPRQTATGFFRVEKINGRWWAIDPEGYLFIHMALNSVSLEHQSANQIYAMMREHGFNGFGNWTWNGPTGGGPAGRSVIGESTVKNTTPMAYTPRILFIGNYRNERLPAGTPHIELPVFDPGFETKAFDYAQGFLPFLNDPHVFGYFTDNELPFRYVLSDHLAITNTNDPNYVAAFNFLAGRGKSPSNWDQADANAYMALAGERYYSVVHQAIRSVDTNHMILGSRCHSAEKGNQAFMERPAHTSISSAPITTTTGATEASKPRTCRNGPGGR